MAGRRGILLGCAVLALTGAVPEPTQADEIRLKDGKKLYGVIVAYEDNMFKVKTDFGFVLVEKDKIAAIIPTVPGDTSSAKADSAKAEAQPVKKPDVVKAEMPPVKKPDTNADASQAKKSVSAKVEAAPVKKPDSAKADAPVVKQESAKKSEAQKLSSEQEPSSKVTGRRDSATPAATPSTNPAAVAAPPNKNTAESSHAAAPAPQVVEPPVNREAVEGNSYVNYTYGFRMYKAPSWRVIDDARQTIPNAVVAMGTVDESTLMVVAEEKSKKALQPAAADVESRLRETYGNYRRISQRSTVAGGFPAVEIRYRGIADEHDWSGTLVVVARNSDTLSILGMTYAMTDLIQIQENVIARAIASLEFTAR
jgi:hypothetical protein